ncbi:MAG: hypothetical protein OXI96_03915 [Acidimicrobiaceae bacterium]|nr:hypothetical protein [Acidimicrobiaceae bacterium]
MRAKVRVGDLVVLPRKKISQLALGIVTRGYWYRNIPDSDTRPPHVVSVDWKRTDVPRTAVKQDLLNSLGASLTLCSIKRNDARRRLHHLLLTGQDPGVRSDQPPKRRTVQSIRRKPSPVEQVTSSMSQTI